MIGAVLVLLTALFMRHRLETRGLAARIAEQIKSHGLEIDANALKQHSYDKNASVRSLMGGEDMTAAVEASKAAGFSSDIDRRGEVYCLLAELGGGEVLTVFVVDEEVELAFIQTAEKTEVKPING